MIQIYFAAGCPGANLELKNHAMKMMKFFRLRRRLQKLSTAELAELRIKTIRETPPEEVKRRMELIKSKN